MAANIGAYQHAQTDIGAYERTPAVVGDVLMPQIWMSLFLMMLLA